VVIERVTCMVFGLEAGNWFARYPFLDDAIPLNCRLPCSELYSILNHVSDYNPKHSHYLADSDVC
jgi:hypothetical protein